MASVWAVNMDAQRLRSDYVKWPSSQLLYSYVNAWVKGEPLTSTWNEDGVQIEWEDEEFFISRVKLKPYITNSATQVYDIARDKDKNLLFWVPIGYDNLNGVKTNALPNGMYDSEVFSMWPYVTHYGNWTSPYGWVPGGFADAAHKHGTAVSGVASIPNATLSGKWLTCITEMGNMSDSEEAVKKLGDFLYYHGVDGLGYNSEYRVPGSITVQTRLNTLHASLMKYMTGERNCVKFENPWYNAVTNAGNNEFWSSLADWNCNAFGDKDNPQTIYFINYGWSQLLDYTDRTLAKMGRDPRDLYMGMDMQGGAKFKEEWPSHLTMDYSIGLWGAHDFNYLFGPRTGEGSSDRQKQEGYQKRLEQWFTNGNRNPADRIDVRQTMQLSPSDDWFGMSPFLSARSSLGWDLSAEPFITYFNLGNGTFFNWKGERCNDNEWYNIGVQDYMPTWRFWWATELLGNTPDKVAADGLKASFTWDDAYVGGSCLRIQGTSDEEYLHLFKTQYELREGDVITVRYKLLEGKADLNLILTAEGDESTPLNEEHLGVLTTATVADNGAWVSKTFRLSGANASLARTIALVGLHFSNAENLDLCLGEFSIRRGATPTPQTPVVRMSKVLCNNMSGVDGKIIFRMPNDKPAGEPVYNLDVNASMYKLYAQYEGGAAQFMGTTTSWAGLVYAAKPDVEGAAKVRFGVSAVSVDTDSESDIAWGEYMSAPSYVTTEGVEIDKKIIKPGEEFTVKYTDPRHAPATWAVYSSEGRKVIASEGNCVVYTCPGLDAVGVYDLVINEGTAGETAYPYLIQVSAEDKGALPEIRSLTVNGTAADNGAGVEFKVGETFSLGYTGRKADGEVSQGVRINGSFVGAPVKELGLTGGATSFSFAAWVKFDYPAGSSCGLSIENRADKWPINHWGFFWMNLAGTNGSTAYGRSVPAGGVESYTFRTATNELKYNFTNSVIPPGVWTHVAFTFDWADSGFKSEFYINGVKQTPVAVECTAGTPTATEDTYIDVDNKSQLGEKMWLTLGGGRGEQANYNDGTVDDVVVWQGAMTAEEVRRVMAGLDKSDMPSQVMAYWDMEEAAPDGKTFAATGSKAGAPLCNFVIGDDPDDTSVNTAVAQIHVPAEAVYAPGSPFIKGSGYKVTTTPTWTMRNLGTVSDASGNDVAGKAEVSFQRGGDYTVRLSLDNTYGSHEMDYPVFSIADSGSGITDVNGEADDAIDVHAVNGMLFLEFAADGDYNVSVYDTMGRLVGRDSRSILASEKMSIRLGSPGIYIVSVTRNGTSVRNIKVKV